MTVCTPPLVPMLANSTDTMGKCDTSEIIAIIPAYNEELTISMVVHLSSKYVDRIIVVDDGSTDRTSEVARLAGAEVITIERNKGKAHAIKVGLTKAKECGCTIVVLLDADGQHNPDEIPHVVHPIMLNEADLVIGSRYLSPSHETPRYRRFGQKTLDIMTNLGDEQKISDTQSGFRAMKCSKFDLTSFKSEGYNVETDMIHHFMSRDLTIMEVPITVKYEVPHKHKKNPVHHGIEIFMHLIGLISYRRPLLSFGVPGFLLVSFGSLLGAYVIQRFLYDGVFHYVLSMFFAFTIVLGLMLMTTALILNSLIKIVKMET